MSDVRCPKNRDHVIEVRSDASLWCWECKIPVPAATGSGEPHVTMHRHDVKGERCDICDNRPTPPVNQPTVTLDRETFDKAIARLERLRQILSPHAGYDGGRCAECVAVLYLLRAAEQK